MNDTRGADGAVILADFDEVTANLFNPDLRFEPDERDVPSSCSDNCTNDGCTGNTTC